MVELFSICGLVGVQLLASLVGIVGYLESEIVLSVIGLALALVFSLVLLYYLFKNETPNVDLY